MSSGETEITQAEEEAPSNQIAPAPAPVRVQPRAITRTPVLTVDDDVEPLILTTMRKRWWVLLICVGVSGFAAVTVARQYEQESAELYASLLYTGLPLPPGPKVYTPLTMETYAALLKSPSILNSVIEKRGLTISPAGLSRLIEVTAAGRAGMVDIKLQWADAAEGEAILNDLLEAFNNQVVDRRKQTITQHIRHVEQSVLNNKARVEQASERLRDFHRQHGYSEQDLAGLPDTVSSLQSALNTAEIGKAGLEIQLSKLTQIHESLVEEFKETLLEEMRNTFKQAAAVFAPNHRDWPRIQAIKKKLDGFAARLEEDTTSIEVWKQQFNNLGQDVLPSLNDYPVDVMYPIEQQIVQVEAKKNEVELGVSTKTAEIAFLQKRLAGKQKDLDQLKVESRPQLDHVDELRDDFEEADAARQRVQNQLTNLQQLEQCDVKEFAVVTPAALTAVGITSNFKKLFVAVFCIAVVVLSAPVFACEYLAKRENSVDATARRFGLPVFARGAVSEQIVRGQHRLGDDESLRLLALRIQQSLKRSGSIIAFCGLEHENSPISLISQLAKCFAEREEKVLVIDASKSAAAAKATMQSLVGESPHLAYLDPEPSDADEGDWSRALTDVAPGKHGISDFLSHAELKLADLVLETRIPRVDCIHSGSQPFPKEGLATRRMSELLEKCRKHYSLILIAGPSTRQRPDVEMLAARSDGMLFTVPPTSPVLKRGHEVLQELIEIEAPVMGVIG